MQFSYQQFRIFIHLIIAFVFLAETFIDYLPQKIYEFLKTHKDQLFGCYYIYLAYEIYSNIKITDE
jgi:hypothetical protein